MSVFELIFYPLWIMFDYVTNDSGSVPAYAFFVYGFFAAGIIAGAWKLVLNLAKYRGE